ncbi:MAG: SDR family NAD(P)-dependent oxidoreductase [Candidatus Cloacimonadaceae bacterium]|nr:SDR family NAD(P)-dependent oxidoreductase [Candidatus Cloacimonadota bacterium]MCB5254015.1 SDR family NAD(P)-dependent oxidoreductase [Candidatus Cloacimonadota bacterium]MCK9178696.1 SDR family NAD(P)-dependent oxidoreductase [Candidatus Cloacimonadota bacterium]MCK9243243.1 SDR family NAD(P)-dependent oxidoreductase [Candidatus Cloacimonadota bacterium]MDY0128243.1 SDR family NAD(P)-dependent oxidoreductase [Candidatus Cloacimonadaceae bacterium]
MKILITGGAGFIGSHLAERLLKEGHEVYAIDNLSTGSLENIKTLRENPKFHFHMGSILDRELMSELISKCKQVYHLAAAVGVKYIIENPLLSLKTNITGTDNVLELCNKYKSKALITSSSEIYGKSEKMPFSEQDDRLLGSTHISRWGYSCSKAIDEFMALAFHREKKLPVVIVRCFNTVGPRQSGQYGMVLPKFIKSALMDQPIVIFGTGKQTRCFADVSDVVGAFIKLMNSPECEGEIFNVGTTEAISIEELAQKVKKMCESKSKIEYMSYEVAYEEGFEDMMNRKPDLDKIKEFIGYEPEYRLDDIITRMIEYYEN